MCLLVHLMIWCDGNFGNFEGSWGTKTQPWQFSQGCCRCRAIHHLMSRKLWCTCRVNSDAHCFVWTQSVPFDIILTRSKVADFFIRNIKHLNRFAPRVSRHPDGRNLISLSTEQNNRKICSVYILLPCVKSFFLPSIDMYQEVQLIIRG